MLQVLFFSRHQLLLPSSLTVLHVEQEVVGDDTVALQSVLESDTEREELLKREKDLLRKQTEDKSSTELEEVSTCEG